MNINFRQLRAFVSIGRLRSFTKAADALHATQPALSAQIRELEEALGVKLFDRSTRSVTLTQAGEDLLPVVDNGPGRSRVGGRACARCRASQYRPRDGGGAAFAVRHAACRSWWHTCGRSIRASSS